MPTRTMASSSFWPLLPDPCLPLPQACQWPPTPVPLAGVALWGGGGWLLATENAARGLQGVWPRGQQSEWIHAVASETSERAFVKLRDSLQSHRAVF